MHSFLKHKIIILMLLWSIFSLAQREPQYTQYMYNIGSFNPAYVGSVESPEILALYRAQWVDIPGAPKTLRFGANMPLANDKMGLGFNVVSDQLGPSSQTYIDIGYSYQVNLTPDSWLSFGLDVGGSFLNLDYSEGNFQNPSEPIIGGDNFNQFYPIVGGGVFMYGENWYTGISTPNFLTLGIYDQELESVIDNNIQLDFIAGYVFDISDNTKFKPALLLNYIDQGPLTVNISANFLFLDAFTLGASYRLDNAVSGLAGFQISNSMFLGYSYDYNTNGLGEFTNGSHEAILKFYLGNGNGNGSNRNKNRNNKSKGKPKQVDSPRFF